MKFNSLIVSMFILTTVCIQQACKTDGTSPKSVESVAEIEHVEPFEDNLSEAKFEKIIDTLEAETVIKNPSAKEENLAKEEAPKPKPPKKKKKKVKPRAKIEFLETQVDFGEIMQGDTVEFKFVFKNTGKAPLEILEAIGTCGCTRPSFPFIPIEPGEEGYIGVQYISLGKSGPQDPSIHVESNGSAKGIDLVMKGFVKVPEKEETVDSSESLKEKLIPNKLLKDTIPTAVDSTLQNDK